MFLWVDPHTRNYIEKEMRRGRHKEMGREFNVDEVEDRTLATPRWADKGPDNREEELPEWPGNPVWDDDKDERDHSEPPTPAPRLAKTEWEKYEESDNEMFWDQMPRRRRHYRFNGQTYEYEGARVEQKPLQPHAWQSYHWERPSLGYSRLHVARHDRDRASKLKGVYQISDGFGTSWN